MKQFKYLRTERLVEMRSTLTDMIVHSANDMVKSKDNKEILNISEAIAYNVKCIKDIDKLLSKREMKSIINLGIL